MTRKTYTKGIKKIKTIEYIDDKIFYFNNIDENVLDECSEFLIGSITKIFTAISILLLQQENKINVHDKITKYIDIDQLSNTSIFDIINHKSGLINIYHGFSYDESPKKFKSATDVHTYYFNNNMKLIDESLIGTYFYSNLGYILLGVLIEKVSKMTYSKFAKKYILKKLKMKSTGISKSNITLYDIHNNKLSKKQMRTRSAAASAGSYKSCVYDLDRFANFIKLLNVESVEILKKIYFFKQTDDCYRISHNGGIIGGMSDYRIKYDNEWNIKNVYIRFITSVS